MCYFLGIFKVVRRERHDYKHGSYATGEMASWLENGSWRDAVVYYVNSIVM